VKARLRGITWDHPRGLDSLLAAEAARPAGDDTALTGNTEVTWTARSLKDFGDLLPDTLAARYDLLVIDHPHVPHAVAAGLLLPLDGTGFGAELADLAAQSVGPSHASYQYAGRQWALPVDAAAQVAAWRPDLLPAPPRTWDEVRALAAAGKVLWPGAPTDAIASFLTVAASRGTPVSPEPGGGLLPAADGRAVLAHLHRLADAVPAWCLGANPIDIAERLSGDDGFSYVPLTYGYSNYARAGFRPRRLACADMPLSADGEPAGSCLGGAGIAVSARSEHPAEAVRHAFWLASAATQRGPYFTGGGQPANAVAWDDDAVNAVAPGFFRATRRTLDLAWVRPRHPGWPRFQEQAGNLVSQALRRSITDVECLAGLDRLYDESQQETEADARADR
jgi:multiple sugar transport system substrate-binding protein